MTANATVASIRRNACEARTLRIDIITCALDDGTSYSNTCMICDNGLVNEGDRVHVAGAPKAHRGIGGRPLRRLGSTSRVITRS